MPTERQIRFAKAYIAPPDGTKAAIAAGFSAKTAHVAGCKLLKDPWIAAEIAKGQAKFANKFDIDATTVLGEPASNSSTRSRAEDPPP